MDISAPIAYTMTSCSMGLCSVGIGVDTKGGDDE
jgi:hypothetical protein